MREMLPIMMKHQSYWIGFFTASLISLPIAIGLWGASEKLVFNLAQIFFGAAIALLAVLFVVLMCRKYILRTMLGLTEATTSQVTGAATNIALAVAKRDTEQAIEGVGEFSKTLTAWYAWQSFYRWVIRTAFLLVLGVAGLTGTVLLFQQNEKIDDQTDRIDVQNAMLALDLTDDFRQRLTSSELAFWGPENVSDLSNFPGNQACSLGYKLGFESGTVANQSTILSIVELAADSVVGDQVVAAIKPLLFDNDQFVALSALLVLDQLGKVPEDTQIFLDQAFIYDLSISSSVEISFNRSVVSYLNCPNCSTTVSHSYLYSSAFESLRGWKSVVHDRRPSPLTSLFMPPASNDSYEFWETTPNSAGIMRADIDRLSDIFYAGRIVNASTANPLPEQFIITSSGGLLDWDARGLEEAESDDDLCFAMGRVITDAHPVFLLTD